MLDAAWYAVAVRNNFERIVAQSLCQKDYEILYLFTFVYRPRTLLLQDLVPEWLSRCRHLARFSDVIEGLWNHGDTSHFRHFGRRSQT